MSNSEKKVVVAQMRPRERREWNQDVPRKKRHYPKRLQKKHALLAAVVLCLGSAAALTLHHADSVSAVSYTHLDVYKRQALAIAERLDAEIISMDSMQIYRHMDIGTAKPTREEQARVPHHCLLYTSRCV